MMTMTELDADELGAPSCSRDLAEVDQRQAALEQKCGLQQGNGGVEKVGAIRSKDAGRREDEQLNEPAARKLPSIDVAVADEEEEGDGQRGTVTAQLTIEKLQEEKIETETGCWTRRHRRASESDKHQTQARTGDVPLSLIDGRKWASELDETKTRARRAATTTKSVVLGRSVSFLARSGDEQRASVTGELEISGEPETRKTHNRLSPAHEDKQQDKRRLLSTRQSDSAKTGEEERGVIKNKVQIEQSCPKVVINKYDKQNSKCSSDLNLNLNEHLLLQNRSNPPNNINENLERLFKRSTSSRSLLSQIFRTNKSDSINKNSNSNINNNSNNIDRTQSVGVFAKGNNQTSGISNKLTRSTSQLYLSTASNWSRRIISQGLSMRDKEKFAIRKESETLPTVAGRKLNEQTVAQASFESNEINDQNEGGGKSKSAILSPSASATNFGKKVVGGSVELKLGKAKLTPALPDRANNKSRHEPSALRAQQHQQQQSRNIRLHQISVASEQPQGEHELNSGGAGGKISTSLPVKLDKVTAARKFVWPSTKCKTTGNNKTIDSCADKTSNRQETPKSNSKFIKQTSSKQVVAKSQSVCALPSSGGKKQVGAPLPSIAKPTNRGKPILGQKAIKTKIESGKSQAKQVNKCQQQLENQIGEVQEEAQQVAVEKAVTSQETIGLIATTNSTVRTNFWPLR